MYKIALNHVDVKEALKKKHNYILTYQPGELAEPPGDVDGQHGTVALLESQVGQVVREATELLGDTGIAEVQHNIQAKWLEGGQVALPGEVIELDAGWVLLVL